MTEISRVQCPSAEHKLKVNTEGSDSFSFNTESQVGKCFSCGVEINRARDGDSFQEYEGKPVYFKKYPDIDRYTHLNEEEQAILEEIIENPPERTSKDGNSTNPLDGATGEFKTYRSIPVSVREFYGVKQYDNPLECISYVYPSGGYKLRYLKEKAFSIHGKGVTNELFGSDKFPKGSSSRITVAEGEEDAMAAYYMINTNPKFLNPVVSVPQGKPSGKFWDNTRAYLSSFEEIILVLDNDKVGHELTKKFYDLYGEKVKVVHFGDGKKDPCDYLKAGEKDKFNNLWWKRQSYAPESIVTNLLDLYEDAPVFQYCPTGIRELDDRILGLHKGIFTLVSGPTGIGKTAVLRYLENQCLINKYKVAVQHREETPRNSLMGILSYTEGVNLTNAVGVDAYGEDRVVEAVKRLQDSGQWTQIKPAFGLTYEDVVKDIRWLVQSRGIDYVFLEPLQDFFLGDDKSKESQLTNFSVMLTECAEELNIGVIGVAHTNADGDIKYCKSIEQKAGIHIHITCDRDEKGDRTNNINRLRVKNKNRIQSSFGDAGGLEFDNETFTSKPWDSTLSVDERDFAI